MGGANRARRARDRSIQGAVDAFAGSLPTLVHAKRFFEAACERLGRRAVASGETDRFLLHAIDPDDPEWLVPEPFVDLAIGQAAEEMPLHFRGPRPPVDRPPDPVPTNPPDIAPRGTDMRDGRLRLAEGPSFFVTRYSDRGFILDHACSAGDPATQMWHTERPFMLDPSARPPQVRPVSALVHPGLGRGPRSPSHAVDLFDPAAPISGCAFRVRVPPRSSSGIRDVWLSSLFALRETLFRHDAPAGARVLVVDALGGQAVTWGATRDETLVDWRREVERVHLTPKPPPPIPLPVKPRERQPVAPPEGVRAPTTEVIHLEGRPRREERWPLPTLENVPAGLVPIPPLPRAPALWSDAGFARWKRLLGRHGLVSHGLVREDDDGWTMVGEGVLDLVEPGTIDAEMDTADRAQRRLVDMDPRLQFPGGFDLHSYAVWDSMRQKRGLARHATRTTGSHFDPITLDGDELRWTISRLRRPG